MGGPRRSGRGRKRAPSDAADWNSARAKHGQPPLRSHAARCCTLSRYRLECPSSRAHSRPVWSRPKRRVFRPLAPRNRTVSDERASLGSPGSAAQRQSQAAGCRRVNSIYEEHHCQVRNSSGRARLAIPARPTPPLHASSPAPTRQTRRRGPIRPCARPHRYACESSTPARSQECLHAVVRSHGRL